MSSESGKEIKEQQTTANNDSPETKTEFLGTNKIIFLDLPLPPEDPNFLRVYSELMDMREMVLIEPSLWDTYRKKEQLYLTNFQIYWSDPSVVTAIPEQKLMGETQSASKNQVTNSDVKETKTVLSDTAQIQGDDMDLPSLLPPSDDEDLQEKYGNLVLLKEVVNEDASEKNVSDYRAAKEEYLQTYKTYQGKSALVQQTLLEGNELLNQLHSIGEAQKNELSESEIAVEMEGIESLFLTEMTAEQILTIKMAPIKERYQQLSQQSRALSGYLVKIRSEGFQVDIDPNAEIDVNNIAEQKETKSSTEKPPIFGSLKTISITSLEQEIEKMIPESEHRVRVIKFAMFRLQGESESVSLLTDLTSEQKELIASFRGLQGERDVFNAEKNSRNSSGATSSSPSFTDNVAQSFFSQQAPTQFQFVREEKSGTMESRLTDKLYELLFRFTGNSSVNVEKESVSTVFLRKFVLDQEPVKEQIAKRWILNSIESIKKLGDLTKKSEGEVAEKLYGELCNKIESELGILTGDSFEVYAYVKNGMERAITQSIAESQKASQVDSQLGSATTLEVGSTVGVVNTNPSDASSSSVASSSIDVSPSQSAGEDSSVSLHL